MKFTNKQNLPEPFVKAASGGRRAREDKIAVTELSKPPQMRVIEYEHWDEIEVDVADSVWAILGSSVHSLLEKAGGDNALQEELLRVKINDGLDVTLGGKIDRLDADGLLTDWKVTSVYSFLLGAKPDWIEQLNCYAALYRAHGFEVKKLQIIAILRDWTKRRAQTEVDYPKFQVMVKDIPLWPNKKAVAWIKGRVRLHQEALKSGVYSECNDEERWARDHKWAVMKDSNKRATKVFADEELAEIYAKALQNTKPGKYRVEHRPAESIRCKDYCNAAPWCGQWKKILASQEKQD
jgi:hypothetical protein